MPLDGITYTGYTIGDPLEQTTRITAEPYTTINTNYANWNPQPTINWIDRYITESDLDKFARKIYKIIQENTKIDISEDEFISLLQEDDS